LLAGWFGTTISGWPSSSPRVPASTGITVEDAIWAMQHARLVKPELDESRVPGRARPTLYIGPSRDPRHPLLEVMVEILPPSTVVIST
jgi:hypothetical protein